MWFGCVFYFFLKKCQQFILQTSLPLLKKEKVIEIKVNRKMAVPTMYSFVGLFGFISLFSNKARFSSSILLFNTKKKKIREKM